MKSRAIHSFTTIACAAISLLTMPASRAGYAQEAEPEPPWHRGISEDSKQRATELAEQGLQLHRDVQWQAASEKYQKALKHWPGHPEIHYYLGLAQDKLGQPLRAYHSLDEALRFGAESLDKEEYRQQAKAIRARLMREELAEITVSCPLPGAAVSLDGKPWFAGPGEERKLVIAGVHKVTAEKRGYHPVEQATRPEAGDRAAITLRMEVDRGVYSVRRFAVWVPWTVIGSGVLLGAIGGGVHMLAKSDFDRYDRAIEALCPERTICGPEAQPEAATDIVKRADRKQRGALALYGLAGAAVLAGTGLLLLNRPELHRDEYRDPNRWQLAPVVSPTSVGMRASWSF